MTKSYEPRFASLEDIPHIFRIRLAVNENEATLEYLAELGITEESLLGMIGSTHGCWCIGQADEMAAFAMSDRESAMIEALFVLPEHEGMGYGSSLLRVATEDLFNRGHRRITLFTGPETRAYGFYISQGWQATGRVKKDDVELEKLLLT